MEGRVRKGRVTILILQQQLGIGEITKMVDNRPNPILKSRHREDRKRQMIKRVKHQWVGN